MESIPQFPSQIEDARLLVATENREVYRAFDTQAESEVVVKCLRTPFEEIDSESFRNEYLRLEALDHPYWVRPDRFFTLADGSLAFTLEYSQGKTFDEFPIRDWTPDTLEVARQVLSGLHALHVNGYAQLDLKPDQLLIEWKGQTPASWDDGTKVLDADEPPAHVHMFDLGLSSPLGAAIPPAGTPGYMAPELLQRAKEWDARVDLYAFGALLYELIIGEKVFQGAHGGEVMRAQLQGPNLDALYRSGQIPRPLVRLLGELLSPDPEFRPLSAPEVWTRLREIATGQTTMRLPTNLTGARRLPFMGREAEVEAFQKWLLDDSVADRRCFIRGEQGLGASRLHRRFAAIAQTQDWLPSEDGWTREDGSSLQIESEVLPPTLNPSPRASTSMSEDRLELELSAFSSEDMTRLAASRGLTARSLIDEVVRVSMGRPALLDALISVMPTPFDSAARNGRVDVAKMINQLEVPEAWKDWVRESLHSEPEELDSRVVAALRNSVLDSDHGALGDSVFLSRIIVDSVPDLETATRVLVESGELTSQQKLRLAALTRCLHLVDVDLCFQGLLGEESDFAVLEAFRMLGKAKLLAELSTESIRTGIEVVAVDLGLPDITPADAEVLDLRLESGPLFESVALCQSGELDAAARGITTMPIPQEAALARIWLRCGIKCQVWRSLQEFDPSGLPDVGVSWADLFSYEVRAIDLTLDPAAVRDSISRLLAKTTRPLETMSLLVHLGVVQFDSGDIDQAQLSYEAALRINETVKDRSMELLLLMNLGGVLFERGEVVKLARVLSSCADIARSKLSWLHTELVLANLSLVLATMGELGAAMRAMNEGLALAVSNGREKELYARHRSAVLENIGRSTHFFDTADSLPDDIGPIDEAVFDACLGVCMLRVDQPDAGRKRLRRALQQFEDQGALGDKSECIALWVLTECDLQNQAAVDEISPLLTGTREHCSALGQIQSRVAELEVAVCSAGGDPIRLLESLEELRRDSERLGLAMWRWRLAWQEARLFRDLNEPSRQRTALERGKEELVRVAAGFDDVRDARSFLGLPACLALQQAVALT